MLFAGEWQKDKEPNSNIILKESERCCFIIWDKMETEREREIFLSSNFVRVIIYPNFSSLLRIIIRSDFHTTTSEDRSIWVYHIPFCSSNIFCMENYSRFYFSVFHVSSSPTAVPYPSIQYTVSLSVFCLLNLAICPTFSYPIRVSTYNSPIYTENYIIVCRLDNTFGKRLRSFSRVTTSKCLYKTYKFKRRKKAKKSTHTHTGGGKLAKHKTKRIKGRKMFSFLLSFNQNLWLFSCT